MTKIENILTAIKDDLLPLTKKGVEEGNHVFGGMVLDAASLKTIVAGTNNRQGNPIFHGEIDTVMIDYPYIECNCYIQSVARTMIVD